MEYNRYKFLHLVENLANYKEIMAKYEEDNKEEDAFYQRINETPEVRNFVVEAEKQIIEDLRAGVDIEEKYSTRFHEDFPLPEKLFVQKGTDKGSSK